jgi:iron complex outermembrane receptor protein
LGSAHQFTVVGGANYYGKRPVTIPNTQYLPSVTTYDAGLRYQYKDKVTVNLNVANLTDESYWSYYRDGSDGITGGDGLLLGDPRTISFSVKYMF